MSHVEGDARVQENFTEVEVKLLSLQFSQRLVIKS